MHEHTHWLSKSPLTRRHHGGAGYPNYPGLPVTIKIPGNSTLLVLFHIFELKKSCIFYMLWLYFNIKVFGNITKTQCFVSSSNIYWLVVVEYYHYLSYVPITVGFMIMKVFPFPITCMLVSCHRERQMLGDGWNRRRRACAVTWLDVNVDSEW